MAEFFASVTQFPTVIFAGALILSLVYWLAMIAGIGGDEGDAGDLGDSGLDVDGDAGFEGGSSGPDALLSAIGIASLRRVPLSVALTFTSFWGWVISYVAMRLISAPSTGVVVAVGLAALLGGLRIGAWCAAPFGRLFDIEHGPSKHEFVGRTCVIASGTVTHKYGQATLADGGAGMILQVRCAEPNALKKGVEALLIEYDAERDTYVVEDLAALIDDATQGSASFES
jgi:hypothetical protein